MKKGVKILIGVVLSILILVSIYIVLIIKGVLPNPFIDNKDLVCTFNDHDTSVEEKIIFLFDKNCVVRSYLQKRVYIYSDEKEAKEYYDNFLKKDSSIINTYKDREISLEGNKIYMTLNYEIDENSIYYKKTKEEIKDIYEKEYIGHTCE